MSGKAQKIYEALVEGAEKGKSGNSLYRHVMNECPKTTSKKIVKASLLALSDPDLKDPSILQVIYALAIKHRVDPATKDDLEVDEDQSTPSLKKRKKAKDAEPASAASVPDLK